MAISRPLVRTLAWKLSVNVCLSCRDEVSPVLVESVKKGLITGVLSDVASSIILPAGVVGDS